MVQMNSFMKQKQYCNTFNKDLKNITETENITFILVEKKSK